MDSAEQRTSTDEQRTVVITGGTGGIGLHSAIGVAATGARVIEDWRYNRSCGADCGVRCSLPPQMFRSWRGQEDSMAKLCRHYGISCVSLRDAIYSEVMAAAPGYSMPEVAGAGVPPSKSTRGPAIASVVVASISMSATLQ